MAPEPGGRSAPGVSALAVLRTKVRIDPIDLGQRPAIHSLRPQDLRTKLQFRFLVRSCSAGQKHRRRVRKPLWRPASWVTPRNGGSRFVTAAKTEKPTRIHRENL